MSKNAFEASAAGLISQAQLLWNQGKTLMPGFETEFRFHPARRWKFDIAFPAIRLACEYHGGLFMKRKGGHQTVSGSMRDWEKLNEAQIMGWTVLQFGPIETKTGTAMQVMERAIRKKLDDAGVRYRA